MSDKVDLLLVVEDNEDDVFALRWALKKACITNPIRVATDGKQAIEYLGSPDSPKPCLVFLDLKLPYVSGLEVLRWIREQSEMTDLAVVVLSGSDETRDHEQTQALKASFYLVKPAMPQDLRGVLETLPNSQWRSCEPSGDTGASL